MRLFAFLIPLVSAFTHLVKLPRTSIADLSQYKSITHFTEAGIHIVVPADAEYDASKRTVLFIPGVEFSGLSMVQYTESMREHYNLAYVCSCRRETQADFDVLSEAVCSYIQKQKDVVIVGESFGALLALKAGYEHSDRVKGIVLLNSATAYWESSLPRHIDRIRTFDENYFRVIVLKLLALQSTTADICMGNLDIMSYMLLNMLLLDRATVLHRVDEWIVKGNRRVTEDMLREYPCKAVVVASDGDSLFPSVEEGKYLAAVMPNSTLHIKKCNHLVTTAVMDLKGTIDSLT